MVCFTHVSGDSPRVCSKKRKAGENADGEGATGGRAAGWQGARQAYIAIQPRYTAATPDLPRQHPLHPCMPVQAFCMADRIRPQNTLDRSPCLADCNPHRITTSHHTNNTIHTARISPASFLCPSLHSPSSPDHTCLFACLVLGFVHLLLFRGFVLFFWVFLTFFSFGGIFR